MHRIAVIPGDGIGKEVTAEAVKILEAIGGVDLHHLPWGADHYLATGETIPANGYDTLRSFDAILVGALGDPRVPDNRHARDILLGTRFELDLYVNYRPVRLLDDRLCPLKGRTRADVNFVVFRENTEGVYVGVGGRFKAGTPDEIAFRKRSTPTRACTGSCVTRSSTRAPAGCDRWRWPTRATRCPTATRSGSACSKRCRPTIPI